MVSGLVVVLTREWPLVLSTGATRRRYGRGCLDMRGVVRYFEVVCAVVFVHKITRLDL